MTTTGNALHQPDLARSEVQAFKDIPIVDFAGFRDGREQDRQAIAAQIDSALQRVGFFYVINHGVPADLLERLYQQTKDFFDLPEQEKLQVSIDKASNHRGYFPMGRENVEPTATVDLKEGFDIGLDTEIEGNDEGGMRGANQWPDRPAGLKSTMMAYYDEMHVFAKFLCRAMALALKLPEDAFDEAMRQPESRLRLLHYPPQSGNSDRKRMGAGAHTDCGSLTILSQDEIGGLEVQNNAGEWVPAAPIAGSFVCNIGDFMAYWSDGRFVSTKHRVINASGRDRYSIPLFLNPNFDLAVQGFESLLGTGERKEKVSVSTYLRQCYDEIRCS